jgi:hypothetical protein
VSGASTYPLVSLLRDEFDESPWYGFVVGSSDHLVALHLVNDAYALDGYLVVRQADITTQEESFAKRPLVEDALRLKGQAPRDPGPLDLSGVRALMESAQRLYPALVINRERIHPGECEVGTVRMASEDSYVLRWLNAAAAWENDDRPFLFRDVTMVQFGGEYEQTLALVAQARENGV